MRQAAPKAASPSAGGTQLQAMEAGRRWRHAGAASACSSARAHYRRAARTVGPVGQRHSQAPEAVCEEDKLSKVVEVGPWRQVVQRARRHRQTGQLHVKGAQGQGLLGCETRQGKHGLGQCRCAAPCPAAGSPTAAHAPWCSMIQHRAPLQAHLRQTRQLAGQSLHALVAAARRGSTHSERSPQLQPARAPSFAAHRMCHAYALAPPRVWKESGVAGARLNSSRSS